MRACRCSWSGAEQEWRRRRSLEQAAAWQMQIAFWHNPKRNVDATLAGSRQHNRDEDGSWMGEGDRLEAHPPAGRDDWHFGQSLHRCKQLEDSKAWGKWEMGAAIATATATQPQLVARSAKASTRHLAGWLAGCLRCLNVWQATFE